MSCALGFDPFGERGEGFAGHLGTCPHCANVVEVLGSARSTWRDEALQDEARAVFRERRLAMPRARRPSPAKGTSLAIFVAVVITSAWAFAHMAGKWRSPRTDAEPSESAAPTVAASRQALVSPTVSPEMPESAPSTSAGPVDPPPMVSSPPSRPPSAPPPTANELWELGLARLERGDRTAAARLFEGVMNAPHVDPQLRHRAMFRLAEVKLALGDSVTPRELLWQVVRGKDAALGFDAALLLERSAPSERAKVWDAYLSANPDGPLRAQAVARRGAGS